MAGLEKGCYIPCQRHQKEPLNELTRFVLMNWPLLLPADNIHQVIYGREYV